MTVSYSATAESALDATVLKAVAGLVGASVSVTTDEKQSTLTASSQPHAFFQINDESKAVGLTGCIRLLAAQQNANLKAVDVGAVESWIQTTEQTLLPIIRSGEWNNC